MRLCDVSRSPPCGRKESGMTEEELDSAVDVIAGVDAGVSQSLNLRGKLGSENFFFIDEATYQAIGCRRNW